MKRKGFKISSKTRITRAVLDEAIKDFIKRGGRITKQAPMSFNYFIHSYKSSKCNSGDVSDILGT